MENVAAEFVARHEIKIGQQLQNSPTYLTAAIDTVLICGVYISQHAWRHWGKRVSQADIFTVQLVYNLTRERHYNAAIKIAEIAEKFPFETDEHRRMLAINHAIALRDSDRNAEMEKVLGLQDWSATSLRFRTVVAGVRSDFQLFDSLAPKAVAAGELQRFELATWLAFRTVRDKSSVYGSLVKSSDAQAANTPSQAAQSDVDASNSGDTPTK
jgi:hypothetical protein